VLYLATVAALAVGIAVGFLLDKEASDDPQFHVDGGDVGALLWESRPAPLAEPPHCRSATTDGIGRWRCTLRYQRGARADAPVPANFDEADIPRSPRQTLQRLVVTVDKRGRVTGQGVNARFDGCCIRVR
jgi:hypothetical protein